MGKKCHPDAQIETRNFSSLALASLKVLNTNLMLIFKGFILNSKFKQIGVEIKIWSDLLEHLCTSEFEGTSDIKLFWTTSLSLHSLVRWNHQKIIGFQQKLFFLTTILTIASILYVLQGFEYTNEYDCKILAKRLLMRTGNQRNKGVYWFEKSYALSTYSHFYCTQFPLFDFSSTKIAFFIFYITFYHSFYR